MENIIILAVLLVAVAVGLFRAGKHFHGGGCCGSGSHTIRVKKELTQPKIGEIVLKIQGMHCENCQARVENAINHLDGVACLVDLKKQTATVSYSRAVSEEELRRIVENLGYQVENP